jgi:hypothetical protein
MIEIESSSKINYLIKESQNVKGHGSLQEHQIRRSNFVGIDQLIRN